MPLYSSDIKEEIRSKMPIMDVVSKYVHLERKGSNYFGLCPFHNEKSPSFSVNPTREMYKCFGCGKSGDVFSFIMDVENMSFPEAMEKLAGECGVELPKVSMSHEERMLQDKKTQIYEINKEAALYFYHLLKTPHGGRALNYFHERKLSDETITKWGLGFSDQTSSDLHDYLKEKGYSDELMMDAGLCSYSEKYGWHDKFWNRAMFPILDANGRVIGFGGRVMGEGEPKYLNTQETKAFDKSRNLFGLNFARKSRRDGFILCEGYMDVISLHQAGFDNAVASLGTALTDPNAEILKRFKKPIYLSYDSDNAGVKAALRAIEIFRKKDVMVRVINMRPHKDPDEFIKALGAEAYEKRIEEAENWFLYTIRMKQREYSMEDPAQRTAFQTYMADQIIREFDTDIERSNYIAELCRIYQLPEGDFRALISHEAAKGIKKEAPRVTPDNGLRETARDKTLRGVNKGRTETERLLLSWMASRQDVYLAVKPYVDVTDFQEGTRRKLAEAIYKAWDAGVKCKEVQFLDEFEEPEDREEVAGIFQPDVEINTPSDWNEALRQTVGRVLSDGTEKELKEAPPGDPETFTKMIALQKRMQAVRTHDFGIRG